MEVDAVGADLAEQVNDLDGGQVGADRLAERVAAAVADGPEPECEPVLGPWGVCVTRVALLRLAARLSRRGSRRLAPDRQARSGQGSPDLHPVVRSCDRVPPDDFAVEVGAELRRPLLRGEVHVMQAETVRVAVGPLEVVHQAPQEVALHGHAIRRRALELRQIVPEVHHPVRVVHAAVGRRDVRRGAAVLGDVDLLLLPDVGRVPRPPVIGFGRHEQPRRRHVRKGVEESCRCLCVNLSNT
ncbi:MAG: hypothetical protein MZV63_16020 [Marinilabiliales bacterium]|nr:hypothetical protein [Marinilabiliales bacterium]